MTKALKSTFQVFMLLILVNSLVLVGTVAVSAQVPGVIIIIGSDTTWTKADSPHTLTGPVLMENGVTLTVDAGVSVNLNGYEMRVNGTLRAIGTSANHIVFEKGTIRFTEFSNAWDEQTGTGSILQYSILNNVEIINSVPVSINNNPVDEDNTWTKTDSPITLMGPIIVHEDVILTIERGVTVNLNGYELIVKGTLRAFGTITDPVYFNDGLVTFTEFSKGWVEQTGSGSIIEHVFLDNVNIISNVSLKISNSNGHANIEGESLVFLNNDLEGYISINDSSLIEGNTLSELSITGDSVVVSNNVIDIVNIIGSSPEISHNTINLIEGSNGISPLIFDNVIVEIGNLMPAINSRIDYFIADSPIITDNTIERGIYLWAKSPVITDNTIIGYTYSISYEELDYTSGPWRTYKTVIKKILASGIILNGYPFSYPSTTNWIPDDWVPYLEIGNEDMALIKGNLFRDNYYGLMLNSNALIQDNTFNNNSISIRTGGSFSVTIKDNQITNNKECIRIWNKGTAIENNYIFNNDHGIIVCSGSIVINGNTITDNDVGIEIKVEAQATVRNNTITNNNQGISVNSKKSATIERNLLSGNNAGLLIMSQATIQNNTIKDSSTSIILENNPSVKINHNNIESYRVNSIYLKNTSNNIDVTNNWWGTTDTQTISLTIYDSKYSFDVGTVSFTPLLTEPNPEATSNPIPEFASFVVLPLFLVATLFVVFCGKRFGVRLERL